jgi:hypothetical protein
MVMIKATKNSEAGIFPGPEFMAEMGKLSEEMAKAGILVLTGGLQPSSTGTRITYSGGKRTITDGPFSETKELVGGFAIIEANSNEHAIELTDRVVQLHLKAGLDGEMEIRPFFNDPPCTSNAESR